MATAVPSHWTKPQFTTLIHALALSPSDACSLLPYPQGEITATIRALSALLHNPPTWTAPRHTRALLKRLTGLAPPPKPRRKKLAPPPRHRVSIQLVPAAPRDDALVRAAGAYPFVEVVLKPARRVWDVVRHLYAKWRLPVRVMHEQRDVAVDSLVVELLEKGSRVVRVPYKVLHVDIDWAPLSALFEPPVVSAPVVNTPGRKRVLAPRDDDSFWMGVSSPAKTPPGGHSPVNLHPPREHSCRSGTEPSEHSRPGEQAVLSRLRGHLQRLDSLDKRDEANTPPLAEKSEDGVQDDDDDDDDDFAVIPEQFLRSCSRFDLAHSLPESLLSLGDSSRSRDADHAGRPHKRRKQVHAEAPASGEQDAGVVGNADVVETANDGCVRVLNDALDVARELDLRCEEDLEGMDLFRDVDLPPVVGPPLSLSALFRE